jgi:hypothetical protein
MYELKFARNLFIKDPQKVIALCRASWVVDKHGNVKSTWAFEMLSTLGIPKHEMKLAILRGDADIKVDEEGYWYYVDHQTIKEVMERMTK